MCIKESTYKNNAGTANVFSPDRSIVFIQDNVGMSGQIVDMSGQIVGESRHIVVMSWHIVGKSGQIVGISRCIVGMSRQIVRESIRNVVMSGYNFIEKQIYC